MAIDFTKFSTEFKKQWEKAIEDKTLTQEEISKFSKEDQKTLMEMLSGSPKEFEGISIEIARKQDDKESQSLRLYAGKNANEGLLDLTPDTLKQYPNAQMGYLKDGVVTLYDKSGRAVRNENGEPLRFVMNSNAEETKSSFASWYMEHNGGKFDIETLNAMQELDNRLNNAEASDEDIFSLMRDIDLAELKSASEDDKQGFFKQLDAKAQYKKQQAKAMLDDAKQMLYEAHKNGTLGEKGEAFFNALMAACQTADSDIGLTKFKEFIKEISGINAAADGLTELADDCDDSNLSGLEETIELLKGAGRGLDSFVGTQGAAFIAALAAAGKAAAVAGVGEAFSLITHAYFAYEGAALGYEGVKEAVSAETKEQAGLAGEKIGMSAIMLAGTGKAAKRTIDMKNLKDVSAIRSIDEGGELTGDIISGNKVEVLPAENGKGFVIKNGKEEYFANDYKELQNIIKTKVPEGTSIDFSKIELNEDLCSGYYENQRIENMQKGKMYEVTGSTKLNLANIIQLDLNHPQLKVRIDNLQEGGSFTIGRNADVVINDPTLMVSRVHLIVKKSNGRIYVIDNSTNGTKLIQTQSNANARTVDSSQRFYGKSAINGKAVDITPQTYAQIDNYIEMRYQDELAKLKRRNPLADTSELKARAREIAEEYRPRTQEQIEHFAWVQERQDLFGSNMSDYNCWSGYEPKDQHHGAWKMHLYSVNEADWRVLCDVVIPYLREHDVEWKTFCAGYTPEQLGGQQRGKAFTIYPKNNQHMAQVAKDLDALIRNYNLETNNSNIVGDRQMGSTGRLFYRYELNSGQYKDQVLDLNNSYDYNVYHRLYDANRGEGRYLASDMTPEDDIWLNFDPSDRNAQPQVRSSQEQYYSHNQLREVKLRPYEPYEISDFPILKLSDYTLDLSQPNIRKVLENLDEGAQITIGRQGDIRVPSQYNYVSRVHVIIEKRNGKLYVKDANSTNGTGVISKENSNSQTSDGFSLKGAWRKVKQKIF